MCIAFKYLSFAINKRTFIIAVILSTISRISAQRYDNTNSISFSISGSTGIGSVMEYERILYNGNALFINGSVFSLRKQFNGMTTRAELLYYIATIGYRKYFDTPIPSILPYLTFAPFTGYQKVTNRDQFSPSVRYYRDDEIIYGLNAEIGVEYNFSSFSVFAAFSPNYEVKYRNSNPNIRFGVKLLLL